MHDKYHQQYYYNTIWEVNILHKCGDLLLAVQSVLCYVCYTIGKLNIRYSRASSLVILKQRPIVYIEYTSAMVFTDTQYNG